MDYTRGRNCVVDPSYTAVTVLLQGDYILLFDSSSAIQVSLSQPLVFSLGTAIAPLQYSREYLLNLQYGPNILPPYLEFDIPKIMSNKKKCGWREE